MTPTGNWAEAQETNQDMLERVFAEFQVGDRVLYRGSWGKDPAFPGTIIGFGIEKGAAVYDVRLDRGNVHWGYQNQFDPLPQTMEASNGR